MRLCTNEEGGSRMGSTLFQTIYMYGTYVSQLLWIVIEVLLVLVCIKYLRSK